MSSLRHFILLRKLLPKILYCNINSAVHYKFRHFVWWTVSDTEERKLSVMSFVVKMLYASRYFFLLRLLFSSYSLNQQVDSICCCWLIQTILFVTTTLFEYILSEKYQYVLMMHKCFKDHIGFGSIHHRDRAFSIIILNEVASWMPSGLVSSHLYVRFKLLKEISVLLKTVSLPNLVCLIRELGRAITLRQTPLGLQ